MTKKKEVAPKVLEVFKQIGVYLAILIISVAVGFFGTWGITVAKQKIKQYYSTTSTV